MYVCFFLYSILTVVVHGNFVFRYDKYVAKKSKWWKLCVGAYAYAYALKFHLARDEQNSPASIYYPQ